MRRTIQAAVIIAASLTQTAAAAGAPLRYTGINLPTAAFGEKSIPGTYGTDYIYPEPSTIDYFADKGMNVLRLAVLWERVQHALGGALDTEEIQRIDAVVRRTVVVHVDGGAALPRQVDLVNVGIALAVQVEDREGIGEPFNGLLDRCAVGPDGFLPPRLDLRNDGEAVAGRGPGVDGAVAPLLEGEIAVLGDGQGGGCGPVGFGRGA